MTADTAGRVSSAAAIIAAALGQGVEVAAMACVYCRNPGPAESFASWSAAGRLQSAPCPDCHRQVTLTEAGVQHEFISTWWPNTAEDPGLDVKLERPERRIEVRGELDAANLGVLASAMTTLLDRDTGDTTVDVRGLNFADATGLGALVDFAKKLGVLGASLRVVGATPELRRVFDLVGLRDLAATA